jgi:DNA (cytosine-5)-methyltransferase 1
LKKKYTLFSLFSGAGGLDLGFKLTDRFDIPFGNDILTAATKTYSSNFGVRLVANQPRATDLPAVFLGDVAKLEFDDFDNLQPDAVSGGPPCQDFSIVRGPQAERGGISVSRGRLYAHFIRALIHLQPRVFVFENVPGLISTNQGKAYEVIKEDFSNLEIRWSEIKGLVDNNSMMTPKNYEIIYSGVVDASELGVPQARRRIVIIGLRKDLSQPIWWKINVIKRKVADALQGRKRLVSKYPLTPIEVFEGKPLPELEDRYSELMKEYKGVADEVRTSKALKWKREIWEKLTFKVAEDYFMFNHVKPGNKEETNAAFEEHAKLLEELKYIGIRVKDLRCPDESNRIPEDSQKVLERMKRIPPDENHEFVRETDWEVEGRGISLIYRRINPLKPAYTVVAYGGGGTWGYHYERCRGKLTNRERARLQTFPDEFAFKGTWSEVRAQIGEAVPPLMAKRVGEVVASILEEVS